MRKTHSSHTGGVIFYSEHRLYHQKGHVCFSSTQEGHWKAVPAPLALSLSPTSGTCSSGTNSLPLPEGLGLEKLLFGD